MAEPLPVIPPADASLAAAATLEVSVIVPTLREAANLPIVAERVSAVLAGRSYELIVVDDNSRDGTTEVCATLAQRYPVRLIVREHPSAGLSGAVLEGMRQSRGRVLLVMDADLQHPPERIPALLAPIEAGQARFTLGSRYTAGGGVAEAWSSLRRINSRVATWLARPFALGVHDPMSGFFAIDRETFASGRFIAPTGYKIALELIAKCRVGRVIEVPILFGLRERGTSKLTLREQFRYLEHLSRLYDFTFPRAVPAAKFLITVGLAFAIALLAALLVRTTAAAQSHAWPTAVLAYACGIASTAVFHARYVRTQRDFLVRPSPWADFLVSSVAELVAVALVALYLTARVRDIRLLELIALPFLAGTITRYFMRKELLMDVRGLRYREH